MCVNETELTDKVNLLDYAPENFKDYLQYLRDVVAYNEGRRQQELSAISGILRGRHYIITGNEGVGKEEAARAIYAELKKLGVVRSFAKRDAVTLFDSTEGFASNIAQLIDGNRNTLIYIQNADTFGRKGTVGSTTGIEAICNNTESLDNWRSSPISSISTTCMRTRSTNTPCRA